MAVRPPLSRDDALALAERMIAASPTYCVRRDYMKGYFDGLVAGWFQSGLISQSEMQTLRERLAKRMMRRPWWDLAGRLGI